MGTRQRKRERAREREWEWERVVAIYESPFGTFSIIAADEFGPKVGQQVRTVHTARKGRAGGGGG